MQQKLYINAAALILKSTLLVLIILFAGFAGIAQDTWTSKADFAGNSRNCAVGFGIGDKGYVGTGNPSNQNDFWEYNPVNDTWTQKADFAGMGRANAVGFSIGNKGYIGTGSNFQNDFWEYNPAVNAWTQKANFPGTAREYAVGFSIGSKGYIGTGTQNQTTLFKDFWEYDPATDMWKQKADFAGGARNQAVGFSIGNNGYVGLGHGVDFGGNINFLDFWQFDPAANAWVQKAGLSEQFVNESLISFAIGNKGYLGDVFNESFTEYDPVNNTWSSKAKIPGLDHLAGVGFSISNKGYVGTGIDDNDGKSFLQYSPLFTINTGAVSSSSFCAGSSVSVPFSATTTFYNGNTFTAQLSDAAGNFTNPVNIGNLTTTTSGTINSTIPGNTPGGTGYRIRVISDSPAVTGNDNGSDLTIYARFLIYRDADFDGSGDPNSSPLIGCSVPIGYVTNNLDCDDTKTFVHPGAPEICGDGIDDNCDGQIDEGCAICANATGLSTSNITSNAATLNWSASVNPASWQIKYKKLGTASWTKINIGAAKRLVKISSLKSNSAYKWCMRAKCGNTWTSFSDTLTFKTLAPQPMMSALRPDTLYALHTQNTFKLYPNPSNGQFTVELHFSDNINAAATIELINTMGQIVLVEKTMVSNGLLKKTIFISHSIASGIYLARIMVNDKTYDAKMVYQQ